MSDMSQKISSEFGKWLDSCGPWAFRATVLVVIPVTVLCWLVLTMIQSTQAVWNVWRENWIEWSATFPGVVVAFIRGKQEP